MNIENIAYYPKLIQSLPKIYNLRYPYLEELGMTPFGVGKILEYVNSISVPGDFISVELR
jgi:hypothetical protein